MAAATSSWTPPASASASSAQRSVVQAASCQLATGRTCSAARMLEAGCEQRTAFGGRWCKQHAAVSRQAAATQLQGCSAPGAGPKLLGASRIQEASTSIACRASRILRQLGQL